jgi:hypothetical protein
MPETWPPSWMSHDDPRTRARLLAEAHDDFLRTGEDDGRVRSLVTQSWRRSLDGGLDPESSLAPVDMVDGELDSFRNNHPLAAAMPVIRRLLVEDAVDLGLLVAVSDAAGRLMWVEGPSNLRAKAEQIHFVEGALWSESRAGTNAPGTALALNQPVQIFASEHLLRSVTPWSCSAAPIHDPDTGAVLGALDLTGGPDIAAPRTLSIVKATVAAVEGELRLKRLTAGLPDADENRTPTLRLLGKSAALLEGPAGFTRLSLRHSELLALLMSRSEGMTGEELATAIHESDRAAVTLRAELSRLRGILAPLRLEPRPYRIDPRLTSDVTEVRDALAAGNVGHAVDLYRGPVLPTSEAPGVIRLRSELHAAVRHAVVRSGDPDALLRFGDTEHGRLDYDVWLAAAALLAPSSPRRAAVETHLDYLEGELA